MSSTKCCSFRLGLNVLNTTIFAMGVIYNWLLQQAGHFEFRYEFEFEPLKCHNRFESKVMYLSRDNCECEYKSFLTLILNQYR